MFSPHPGRWPYVPPVARRAAALLALGVLLALVSACGGSEGAAARDDRVPAGAPFMDQAGLAFKPAKLAAKSGEQVYFKNSETAIHTVTVAGKNVSGSMKKNDLFIWTAPAAGSYRVTCDFHPQMKATLTVE